MYWTRYLKDPALQGFVARREERLRLLIRPEYEELTGNLGLDGGTPVATAVVHGGRQPHPLVQLPGGERVVVRRYRRGGALRHLNRERYFLGHRAFEELRATERARSGGVRTPEVVAAAEQGLTFGYTATLVTRWIPDAQELNGWLERHTGGDVLPVLRTAGRQIRIMHAAGVAHPDLNLKNLLVTAAETGGEYQVFVLDFDRARLFRGPVPAGRRARDLQRLARSARKLRAPISRAAWAAFQDGYGSDWPLRTPFG